MKPDRLRERTLVSILVSILLFILVASVVQGWAGSPKKADLSRLVVVGDSLSAGVQNGSLHVEGQINGYASLVAQQAGVELVLPLIGEPGIPNVLTLVDPGPPPMIGQELGVSPGRINLTVQATNLAVPGATVQDALTSRPDLPFDSFTDLVLGLPGLFGGISRSQVEWAEALAPTTIFVWLGNNDALAAAVNGDASLVTPFDNFKSAYQEVMARLAWTGAKLVVANIPDVTVIPFLTPAEDVVAEVAALVGLPLEVIGLFLGIGPGDFVTPDAFDLIGLILAGFVSGPLPANVVLDADEVGVIQSAIKKFNKVIETQAEKNGAARVDIHALLRRAQRHGLVVGGRRLTTAFLGGLFSLDGIHPTNTGYAIIANKFIKALNRQFHAGIHRVNARQIMEMDPLVLPGIGHPASALDDANPVTAEPETND